MSIQIMNKELLAIHTETQIIKAIGERLLAQFSIQRLHLEKGNDETYLFIDDQIKSFLFQSELAYQFLFPSVDKFLQRIRHFQASVVFICYESEPLVCLDAYLAQHQLILKEALETLESYRLIHASAEPEPESEHITKPDPEFTFPISSLDSEEVTQHLTKFKTELENFKLETN